MWPWFLILRMTDAFCLAAPPVGKNVPLTLYLARMSTIRLVRVGSCVSRPSLSRRSRTCTISPRNEMTPRTSGGTRGTDVMLRRRTISRTRSMGTA